jgi:tRNA pseudouridine55 synthase
VGFNFAEGEVLFIDKPKYWTSFDVIKKIQSKTKFRKFGHAGTLDPLATGLLIICSGKKTKIINNFQELEKEYQVEFYLGAVTETFDSEMEATNYHNPEKLTQEKIQEVINRNFLGNICQVPPIYSAIKVNGKRAYELARKGDSVKLHSKPITVSKFLITEQISSRTICVDKENQKVFLLKATIVCSKGTYIRSLVNDLGKKIDVGGFIKDLRRTRIGQYSLENSQSIDEFLSKIN